MLRFLPICLLLPSLAAAQDEGFDGHGFKPAGDDGDLEDLLTTWRSEAYVPKAFGFTGLLEYAESPVVLYERDLTTGDVTDERLLDNVFALNLNGQVGLHERVAIALSAPIWFTTSGQGVSQGAGLGDIRGALPVQLFDQEEDGRRLGLSLVPWLDLPTGDATEFTGNEGFAGGGVASASVGNEKLLVSANLGFDAMPTVAVENVRGGFRGIGGIGASYLVSDATAVRLEAITRPKLSVGEVPGTESPAEALGSVRSHLASGFHFTLGGSAGISPGWSAASFRVFAGAGMQWGKEPTDIDGDGLLDRDDDCPTEPENKNGYQDEEGCPDLLSDLVVTVIGPTGAPVPGASVKVGEASGVADAAGKATVTGLIPGSTMAAGAVTVDRRTGMDGAEVASIELVPGTNEVVVNLRWLPGAVKVVTKSDKGAIVDATVDARGPVQFSEPIGADGEEIFVLEPGEWTLLVNAESFGIERRQLTILPDQRSLVVIEVQLSPAKISMTKEEVVLLQAVEFDFDKATIKEASLPLIQEVANNLLAYPELKKIEVQGHTDSKGSDSYNKKLSQARVDTVLKALAEQGVTADRMVAVGYGEVCPIDVNTSDAGRAANRRVQFIVVDPAPAAGIPCHDGVKARRADPTTVQRTVEEPQK